MGMTFIARQRVSDIRSKEAVSTCIKWFADKIPNENDEQWFQFLETLCISYSSTDDVQVKESAGVLLDMLKPAPYDKIKWKLSQDIGVFQEIILFARGLVDPNKWLEKAQKGYFGPVLKLSETDFNKFHALQMVLKCRRH